MSAEWKTIYLALYTSGARTVEQIQAVPSSRLTTAEKAEVLGTS